MSDKLIVALDRPNFLSAKILIDELGDLVNFYKIGLELMASGDYFTVIEYLKNKNKKIFADLKLYDIAQTVGKAVANFSKHQIDLLTIHSASRDIMARANDNKGLMKIIAVSVLTNLNNNDLDEMGFDKNLSLSDLVEKKTSLALNCGLDGIVASAHEAKIMRAKFGKDFLIITPGIREKNDQQEILNDDQKRVADVDFAIQSGSSYLVIGRPITESKNIRESTKKFINLINESSINS
jgi:orotidine-5'-phosphate decarboxylase